MTARSSLTVVLAAGEGTRMRSSLPKVLHPVAGQSLLAHVLDAAPHGAGASLAVVIGPDHKAVADEVKRVRADASTFVQAERLGTAHAVLAARAAIARGAGGQHGVRGAEALGLNEGRRIGADARNLVGDRLVVRPDHHGQRSARSVRSGVQHMRQQRLAGDGM